MEAENIENIENITCVLYLCFYVDDQSCLVGLSHDTATYLLYFYFYSSLCTYVLTYLFAYLLTYLLTYLITYFLSLSLFGLV